MFHPLLHYHHLSPSEPIVHLAPRPLRACVFWLLSQVMAGSPPPVFSFSKDDILCARPTIDLDALKKDSDLGIAALRLQEKNVRANAREKKTTCGYPSCDHEESPSAPLRACSKCQYVLYSLSRSMQRSSHAYFSAIRYCSTDCQKAHWKAHKTSCSTFSDLPFYRDFDPTLVLPGCQYPQSPVFASGHQNRFGCWIAPGGQITGE